MTVLSRNPFLLHADSLKAYATLSLVSVRNWHPILQRGQWKPAANQISRMRTTVEKTKALDWRCSL